MCIAQSILADKNLTDLEQYHAFKFTIFLCLLKVLSSFIAKPIMADHIFNRLKGIPVLDFNAAVFVQC